MLLKSCPQPKLEGERVTALYAPTQDLCFVRPRRYPALLPSGFNRPCPATFRIKKKKHEAGALAPCQGNSSSGQDQNE